MVLDTTHSAADREQLSTVDNIPVGKPSIAGSTFIAPTEDQTTLKPAPSPIVESRDAAVATPCDSIRMYANELEASKSISVSRHSSGSARSRGGMQASPPSPASGSANEEEREGPPPPAEDEQPAPTSPVTVAANEATPSDVPASKPAEERSVRSELSASVASSVASESATPRPSSPRVTLITVTDADECKLMLPNSGTIDRVRSDISHDSVEVVMDKSPMPTVDAVATVPEEVKTMDDEQAKGESTISLQTDKMGDEAPATESALADVAVETTPSAEQISVGKEQASQSGKSPDDPPSKPEHAHAGPVMEHHRDTAATKPAEIAAETAATSPKPSDAQNRSRKRFGLKKKLSKPTVSLGLPKKPTSPRSMGRSKPPMPPLSKPSMPKLAKLGSRTSLAKKFRKSPSTTPAETGQVITTAATADTTKKQPALAPSAELLVSQEPTVSPPVSPQSKAVTKEELLSLARNATATAVSLTERKDDGVKPGDNVKTDMKEEVMKQPKDSEEGPMEEPKEEKKKSLDLSAEGGRVKPADVELEKTEPSFLPSPPPSTSVNDTSIPAEQTKQSCTAFIVQQDTSMHVNEAEESAKSSNAGGDGKIQTKPQKSEDAGTDQPTSATRETPPAVEATYSAAPTYAVSAQTKESEPNIMEVLYQKAEDCFGDFTNSCGPKNKRKKGKKVATATKDAGDLVETAKESPSGNGGPEKSESPKPGLGRNEEDFTTVAEVKMSGTCEAIDTSLTNSQKDTIDGGSGTLPPGAPATTLDGLFTPLSVATERVSSFVESLGETPSFKSIVENLSSGYESASKATEAAIFPLQAHTGEEAHHDITDKMETAMQQAKEKEATQYVRDVKMKEMVPREKSELDRKLDRAAEMAKKALDGSGGVSTVDDSPVVGNKDEEMGKKRGLFRRNRQPSKQSQLKIFASKAHTSNTGSLENDAGSPQPPKPPQQHQTPTTSPTARLKRGLGTKTKIAATRTRSGMGEVARSSFRRFKQGGKKSVGRLSSPKGKKESSNKAEEQVATTAGAISATEDELQEELATSSLNSQSLNEPQSPVSTTNAVATDTGAKLPVSPDAAKEEWSQKEEGEMEPKGENIDADKSMNSIALKKSEDVATAEEVNADQHDIPKVRGAKSDVANAEEQEQTSVIDVASEEAKAEKEPAAVGDNEKSETTNEGASSP